MNSTILRGLPILSVLLPSIGFGLRVLPGSNLDSLMVADRLIIPSMVAALAVSYALNYRKMPNPMVLVKIFRVDNIHIDLFPT